MKKVLGIGNALVDLLVKIDSDEILDKLELPKGSMTLIDDSGLATIKNEVKNFATKKVTGGSVGNTINGLAALGVKTGFIGKIGTGNSGLFFENEMRQNGVDTLLLKSDTPTGRAFALVSVDGERTFGTYLGAAIEMTAKDLKAEYYEDADIFYAEGYLVQNHELIEEAMKMAKAEGLLVAIDMASYNVVEANKEFMQHLLSEYVDIVFANEEEALAFCDTKDSCEAVNILAENCSIAVVKIGANGSLVKSGDHLYRAGIYGNKPIDKTGAGDSYAAGFFYGLMNDFDLGKCARIGAYIADHVIATTGAKLNKEVWNKILKDIPTL